jgi:hypothetical protein
MMVGSGGYEFQRDNLFRGGATTQPSFGYAILLVQQVNVDISTRGAHGSIGEIS